MVSRRIVFWEVDTQVDFMLPGGKLYVPGAENLVPNVTRLVDAARAGQVFLVSDACVHLPGDEEFKRFPPHCLRGTPGAEILPEAKAEKVLTIPNRSGVKIPLEFSKLQQVVLEKQTLDVFDNPNADTVLKRVSSFTDVGAEFFVFGVVTEYCVRHVARGLLDRDRSVWLIADAIETLKAADGEKAIDELTARGAKLTTTDEALAKLDASLLAERAAKKPRRSAGARK